MAQQAQSESAQRAADELDNIVKAYDVRGLVPGQLSESTARALGVGFAELVGGPAIAVAHDMRDSSPTLSRAFAEGAASLGFDVHLVGLASTDMLYFVSGRHNVPGAMFTASHNPAVYNGVKLCRAGAGPIGGDTGLAEIAKVAREVLLGARPEPTVPAGHIGPLDALNEYAVHLRSLVSLTEIRPLKVVVDAGNGMAGYTTPAVFEGLPLDVVPLYFELDGSFPNHEANPLDPKNLVDLQRAVVEHGADLGLAFDGDADRCFVVDEKGDVVAPSTITALVATAELARCPGSTVIYNLITSAAVPEIVVEHGGKAVRSRVGHSYIKAEMARTDAVFGGEHSAHYYFRDFWRADTGMLAAMHVLAALGGSDVPLSEVTAQYRRYSGSGEINSVVSDQAAVLDAIRQTYAGDKLDELDGLTVQLSDGSWFNVRVSNTEPLLRLNVEARDADRMAELRDEVLGLIQSDHGRSRNSNP
ncbi:MAG TPA: phosphomannomutase/phosphoglucomutase [Mycobacteriales bacterium]|nr:phosphomannomutase/phosphoglucomutase [Mycobacteriales bacterium]